MGVTAENQSKDVSREMFYLSNTYTFIARFSKLTVKILG